MMLNKEKLKNNTLILSWALYDLANQFFALNIVSLYFVRWLTLEKKLPEIFYSITFGVSTFFVAILGPILGAVSDITARRRPFLIFLTLLSVFFTLILGVGESIILSLAFFAVANFGCQAAIVFYNALMKNITPKEKFGLVSGVGKMFGYSGAILALYITKPIILKSGYEATFFPTGVLFLVFALPCMIFIKDKNPKAQLNLEFFRRERISEVFQRLKTTLLAIHKFPGLADFLKGTFFGLCAVNVIILFMSIYATRVFGLSEVQIINLIVFSTFFAMLGSLSSGLASDYLGYRNCFIAVFISWVSCFLGGAFAQSQIMYWCVGALAGFSLGATWVVSRALAVKLVPEEKIGEVFGLFNLIGYIAAIIGALFWGGLLLLLAPLAEWGYRIALLSLILFMSMGFIFLLRIPKI